MSGDVPAGWPASPRRFIEQRWLLDATIRAVGVDWDQGRSRYLAAPCGPDARPDFERIRETVRAFVDIERAFAEAAVRLARLAPGFIGAEKRPPAIVTDTVRPSQVVQRNGQQSRRTPNHWFKKESLVKLLPITHAASRSLAAFILRMYW